MASERKDNIVGKDIIKALLKISGGDGCNSSVLLLGLLSLSSCLLALLLLLLDDLYFILLGKGGDGGGLNGGGGGLGGGLNVILFTAVMVPAVNA